VWIRQCGLDGVQVVSGKERRDKCNVVVFIFETSKLHLQASFKFYMAPRTEKNDLV
jgi:hypothetical protein